MTAPATDPAQPEPTHGCVRCGRPVPIDVALCEECNPLGLKQPAASQVHAIAAGGVVFFVLVLALLAAAGLRGVGPFDGSIVGFVPHDGGVEVTLSVSNEGTKAAATTCRVVEGGRPAGGAGQLVQTPIVPAGGSLVFTARVTALGETPDGLAVDCQSP